MLFNVSGNLTQELLNKVISVINSDPIRYKFISTSRINFKNIKDRLIYASMKDNELLGFFTVSVNGKTISHVEDINLVEPSNPIFSRDLLRFLDELYKLKPEIVKFDIAMGNFRARSIDRRLCVKYKYIPANKPEFIGIVNGNAIFRHTYKRNC